MKCSDTANFTLLFIHQPCPHPCHLSLFFYFISVLMCDETPPVRSHLQASLTTTTAESNPNPCLNATTLSLANNLQGTQVELKCCSIFLQSFSRSLKKWLHITSCRCYQRSKGHWFLHRTVESKYQKARRLWPPRLKAHRELLKRAVPMICYTTVFLLQRTVIHHSNLCTILCRYRIFFLLHLRAALHSVGGFFSNNIASLN